MPTSNDKVKVKKIRAKRTFRYLKQAGTITVFVPIDVKVKKVEITYSLDE